MHSANHLDHTGHDLELIAGHAAGDLAGTNLANAERLLASCDSCATLRDDLVALAAASRALPAAQSPDRDFRLDPAQADRLRRGSWLRGLLRPFVSSGWSARPLAAAFTSVGVAGLLVAAFVPGLLGSVSSAPGQRDQTTTAGQASGEPVSIVDSGGPIAPEAPASGGGLGVDQLSTAEPQLDSTDDKGAGMPSQAIEVAGGGTNYADGRTSASSPAPNPVLIGSIAFLAVGLGLFALRIAGRRLDA